MNQEDVYYKVLQLRDDPSEQISDSAEASLFLNLFIPALLIGFTSISAKDFLPQAVLYFACASSALIVFLMLWYFLMKNKIKTMLSWLYLYSGISLFCTGILLAFSLWIIMDAFQFPTPVLPIMILCLITNFIVILRREWRHRHGWKKIPKIGNIITTVVPPCFLIWALIQFTNSIFSKQGAYLFVLSIGVFLFTMLGTTALHNFYVTKKHQIDSYYQRKTEIRGWFCD